MKQKQLKALLIVLALLVSCFGTSTAAEYWLRTGAFTKTMPDATLVTMWGYALVQYDIGAGVVAGDDVLIVPGPTLTVPPGQGLTIHLTNNLTVPTSIIIPGQFTTMIPTWTDGATGARTTLAQRVRSLTHEAAGTGGTADYVWASIKPGTYLYQSGTHQQVQVQMGLYGPMKNDFAAGQAYAGIDYIRDTILLFSEIDPVIHGHVAGGTYGTPPPTGITSTIGFLPKYFLLNGEPFSSSTLPVLAGNRNQNVLFRFLNAGLKDYVPLLQGLHFSILAEDGNLLPFPKRQYSLILPAGKTMDATVTSPIGRRLPLYDRRLSLTNNLNWPGGMFNYLIINGEPIVDFDGDVKSDIAVYRAGTGDWYIVPSGGGAPYGVGWGGGPADKPVPGDYDGDGKTDVAVYRVGTGAWYVIPSSGVAPYGLGWGGDPTDKPAPGDYDGDGKADIAVYRGSNGGWYVMPSSGAAPYGLGWGGDASDLPVPGDYDGDGKTDVAVYRASTGAWYVVPSSGAPLYGFGWGGDPADKPVPGDYDGDGKTDVAVYRTSTGAWYVYPSGGTTPYGVVFGGDVTDKAVPGDYDRDGKTDIAYYRTGTWSIMPSSTGVAYTVPWGGDPSDVPLTAIWALY